MYLNPYKPALELKGSLLTLMVLHLLEDDNEKIAEQLVNKVSKAPDFFKHAPVVIDLHAVQDDENDNIDLPRLVNLMRDSGLIPVALRGGNSQQHEAALGLNLGTLPDTKLVTKRRYLEPETVAVPIPQSSKVITQPIRSGQQVAALQGDLVVLSAVSHGAEILAHRHIHIYGALRGRALAGVNGDTEARIFCQSLDAELISIAGQYQVNEDLPNNLRNKSVQIYLEEDALKIEPLYSASMPNSE